MKTLFISLSLALLSFGSALASPQFKELNNKNGKTTIKVEIPTSDRDASDGLTIDNVKLYNNGQMLKAKKVDASWGENSTIILEFKKLKKFDDCTLSFTLNGNPVSIDIQTYLSRR